MMQFVRTMANHTAFIVMKNGYVMNVENVSLTIMTNFAVNVKCALTVQ